MVSADINKEVLRLAVPSILANVTVPLVGLVDIAIAGHISDASSIGGIAIGTMLFDLLYWNFGFLRVGTGGLTAQAFGRKDRKGAVGILTKGIKTSMTAAAGILALQWVFVTTVLALLPCSEAVSQFARQYFLIRIWAAPATLSLMVFKGWFIGMQDATSAMTCDLTVNIVNMLASFLLAVHTPLEALGIAYGTLIAQYSGLIVSVVIYIRKFRLRIPSVRHTRLFSVRYAQSNGNYLRLNASLFVRSLCFMGIYIGFTTITSAYGDTQLAVGSIIMKVFMLVSYLIDGFAYAGEALTGRFIGESNRHMLRSSIRCISLWTLVIGIAFTLLFLLTGEDLVRMMTSDHNVIEGSLPYLPWLVVLPLIGSFAFMWDGIFAGATRGRQLMYCMIWSVISFFATYLLSYPIIGTHAVYAALLMHLVVRAIYLTAKARTI